MHYSAKYFFFVIIAAYMFGAMIFKYVSGAKSLSEGISFILTEHKDTLNNDYHFYYVCIVLFSVVSIIFSMGNIENSRVLQIITMYLRFFTTFMMMVGSLIAIFKYGVTYEMKNNSEINLDHASNLFANTIFVFVAHHSIAGIVKPVRPQKSIYNILFYSFTLGSGILVIESILAALAFTCITNDNCDNFP